MRPTLLVSTVLLLSAFGTEANAQYKSAQLGFEGGYGFYGEDLLVDSHSFMVGLRGAFKATDHWWFSARGLLSFRGEQDISQRTVVLLNLTPVAARYYFFTDSFRPFLGITNAFQFFFNTADGTRIAWGVGAEGGLEFKIVRDVFIGLQADALYVFAFERPDDPVVTVTAQLNFFL